MSDTIYNAKQYLTFKWQELFGILVTAFFAAFTLTFNDWGDKTFDLQRGLWTFGLMFVFVLFVFLVTVWGCKVVAIRLGYVIDYRPHTFGLVFGVILTVASAGYLPFFLPGGFRFDRPERLMVGHWRGFYKGWEMGVVSGSFPLLMLAWVMLFNPLYLFTTDAIYLRLVSAVVLIAFYACLPLPMVSTASTGRWKDVFAHLRGTTFGLDVLWASKYWFGALVIFVLLFGALAYIATVVGVGVGIAVYVLLLVLTIIAVFVYSQFFKQ